jgi:methyl-accepting chemotaxis protein
VAASVLLTDRIAVRHALAAHELDRAAREFGSDLTKRVEVHGTSELADAGTAFNAMACPLWCGLPSWSAARSVSIAASWAARGSH